MPEKKLSEAQRAYLERSRPARQKHMKAIQPLGVAKRCPKPGKDQGNVADAAGWAGASKNTIRRAVKAGDLKTASKDPIRLDRDVVKKWAATQEKGKGDLAITDIPARLPGRPGPTQKSGQSEKLVRIRNLITRLGIEKYRRRQLNEQKEWRNQTCIREERFAELEAEYLALTTFLFDEIKPDEIKIADAVRLHGASLGGVVMARQTILERLAKHAPDCVQTLTLKGQGSGYKKYTALVAPRAAIEAALRGENWTPPADGNGEPLPAAEKPASPESEPPKAAGIATKKRQTPKARPGRKLEWGNLLKVYDRLREQKPETDENDIRREAVAAYNRQYANRGNNPKAKPVNLRQSLAYRRQKSAENSD